MHTEFLATRIEWLACLILMSIFWWFFLELGSDRNLFWYCLRLWTTENQLSFSFDDKIGCHEQHWKSQEFTKISSFLRLRRLWCDDWFSILMITRLFLCFFVCLFVCLFVCTRVVFHSVELHVLSSCSFMIWLSFVP